LKYQERCKFEDFLAERYGWGPDKVAQYTRQEINRLVKGAELRKEMEQRTAERGSTPSADQQRREQEALEKFA